MGAMRTGFGRASCPGTLVADKICHMNGHPLDLEGGAVLERQCVYVIPLMESVALPASVMGLANPKSSTGRLDVLTRLITDFGTAFDEVPKGYSGQLYLEVAPQTFSIVVRPGTRLSQLRFQRSSLAIADSELQRLCEQGQLVRGATHARPEKGLVPVTIDLRGRGPGSVIGYKAKKHTERIDLDRVGAYDPREFWDAIEFADDATLILDPDEFYILATAEEVGVPPNLAAEMVPYYTRSGSTGSTTRAFSIRGLAGTARQ